MIRFASVGLVLVGCLWTGPSQQPTQPMQPAQPTTSTGAPVHVHAMQSSHDDDTAMADDTSTGGWRGQSSYSNTSSGAYKKVSIFNGQPNCGAGNWAQERAVILDRDGYYKECDIFNGQCNAPGTWFQGKAVIKDSDGYYKECDIFNGKCNAPGTWFQGDAVVWCEN